MGADGYLPTGWMLTFPYKCRDCGREWQRSYRDKAAFMSAPLPRCTCGSSKVARQYAVPFSHAAVNAKAKADGMYPYKSLRLPRHLPGCRHDSFGHPIIESKAHEREICAGAANGERYERD